MKKLLILAALVAATSNVHAATAGFDWSSYVPSRESIATSTQNFGTRCYQWASNNPWTATAIGLGAAGIGLGGYWYTRPAQELRRWLSSSLEFVSKVTDEEFNTRVGAFTRDTPGMSYVLLYSVLLPFTAIAPYNLLDDEHARSYASDLVAKVRARVETLQAKRDELYRSSETSATFNVNVASH